MGTYKLRLKTRETRTVDNPSLTASDVTTTTSDIRQTFDVTKAEKLSYNLDYQRPANPPAGEPPAPTPWYAPRETT